LPRRRNYLTKDEVVRRWVEDWLFHYKVRVPNANPPKKILEETEKTEAEKR
jgi:hypothetical protein